MRQTKQVIALSLMLIYSKISMNSMQPKYPMIVGCILTPIALGLIAMAIGRNRSLEEING